MCAANFINMILTRYPTIYSKKMKIEAKEIQLHRGAALENVYTSMVFTYNEEILVEYGALGIAKICSLVCEEDRIRSIKV